MKKFLRSFYYALHGIWKAVEEERNLKVQLLMLVVVVFAGFYYRITDLEWMFVIFSSGLVISLELINSSLERVVDLISKELNILAGKAKDIAAGAVLVASTASLIVGILIFKKYIL